MVRLNIEQKAFLFGVLVLVIGLAYSWYATRYQGDEPPSTTPTAMCSEGQALVRDVAGYYVCEELPPGSVAAGE